MIAYVDSSAAAKILTHEDDEPALSRYLDELATNAHDIVSSNLLETELRRTVSREGVSQMSVTALLERMTIVDLTRSVFNEAGLMLPGDRIRSLDALHLAVALRVSADVFVSYDRRQIAAAEAAGLRVVSPR